MECVCEPLPVRVGEVESSRGGRRVQEVLHISAGLRSFDLPVVVHEVSCTSVLYVLIRLIRDVLDRVVRGSECSHSRSGPVAGPVAAACVTHPDMSWSTSSLRVIVYPRGGVALHSTAWESDESALVCHSDSSGAPVVMLGRHVYGGVFQLRVREHWVKQSSVCDRKFHKLCRVSLVVVCSLSFSTVL